jgi:DDE superfamily endonuclease
VVRTGRSELAKRVGMSPSSVLRIWRTFGLQPWRTETFKISPDPLLIDKIRDVAGLYLAPPANAAVFSMDEKPQIQALERTAPVLPMIPGVPERRSFDYVQHGTVDLFAALNIATGKVIGKLSAQHPAVDFRDFLDQIDRQVDPALTVHVICDNLSTCKAPVVHRWLLAHPLRAALHPGLLLVDQPGEVGVWSGEPLPVNDDVGFLVVESDQSGDGQQLPGREVVAPGDVRMSRAIYVSCPVAAGGAFVGAAGDG